MSVLTKRMADDLEETARASARAKTKEVIAGQLEQIDKRFACIYFFLDEVLPSADDVGKLASDALCWLSDDIRAGLVAAFAEHRDHVARVFDAHRSPYDSPAIDRAETATITRELRAADHLTKALLWRIPPDYPTRQNVRPKFRDALIDCLDDLTSEEAALIISSWSDSSLVVDEQGQRVEIPDLKRHLPSLALRALRPHTAMDEDDFQSVLGVDLLQLFQLVRKYLEAADELDSAPGDFFDWYCTVAGAVDYRPNGAAVAAAAARLTAILELCLELIRAGLFTPDELRVLSRNLVESSSPHALRNVELELRRALRTREVDLVKDLVKEIW